MATQFQCNNSVPCFNGGLCVSVDPARGIEACDCPSGFAKDYSFGHYANCLLPDRFYLVFFIVHTILTFLALFFIARRTLTSRAQIRRMGACFAGGIFSFWGNVLAVFVQDGYYEGAAVMSFFLWFSTIGMSVVAITSFLLPLFALARLKFTSVQRALYGLSTLFLVLFFVIAALQVVYCREASSLNYNVVTMVYLILIVLAVFGMGGTQTVAARRLRSYIRDVSKNARMRSERGGPSPTSTNAVVPPQNVRQSSKIATGALGMEDKFADLERRLGLISAIYVAGAVAVTFTVLPVVVVVLLLGSFPGGFVVWAFNTLIYIAASPLMLKFMSSAKPLVSSSSKGAAATNSRSSKHEALSNINPTVVVAVAVDVGEGGGANAETDKET